MLEKRQKGQGAIWIILIIAIVALIALWISKNPKTPVSTTANPETITVSPSETPTLTPTPTKSLLEIDKALKDLNSSAADIDKGLNDSQLDITQ